MTVLELQLVTFRKGRSETIHPDCGMQIKGPDTKAIDIANPDAYLHKRILECSKCGGEVPAFGRIDRNRFYFAEAGLYD